MKCQKVVSEESQLPLEVGTSKPKLRWGCSPRTRATPARSSRSRNSTIAISTSRAGVLARRSHPRAGPRRTTRETTRPRFSSEDEEDEQRRAPSPPPAAAPTWVGPGTSWARAHEPPRPPRRLPWAGRLWSDRRCGAHLLVLASRLGLGHEARGKHRTRPPRRRDPRHPHRHRGGNRERAELPGERRPAASLSAAASSQPNSSKHPRLGPRHHVERGVGSFDDDDDDEDVASPARWTARGQGEPEDRAARLAREGTSRRQDRRGEGGDGGGNKRENRSARSTSRRRQSSALARGGPRAGPGTRSARGPQGRQRSRWTDEPPRRGSWRAPPRAPRGPRPWESGGQWAAGHDLPIAVLTVCAALGGGKGALGSNWRTQAVLQVGHVCALAFALGLPAYSSSLLSDVMAATMARPELAANRRAARGGWAGARSQDGAAAVDDTRGWWFGLGGARHRSKGGAFTVSHNL